MASVFEGLQADTNFFIVRHGESEGNRDGLIQGRSDLPLTSRGLEQARLTGRWFRAHPVDRLFASPLRRAFQTASTMAEAMGPSCPAPVASEHLLEVDTGSFSGRRFKDIMAEDPEAYREFHAHSWGAVPGAETAASLQDRCRDHWRCLVAEANAGARCLVSVSHFGCIQWLFKTTFPLVQAEWLPLVSVGNCAVFHVFVSPRQSRRGEAYHTEWRLMNFAAWQFAEHPGSGTGHRSAFEHPPRAL